MNRSQRRRFDLVTLPMEKKVHIEYSLRCRCGETATVLKMPLWRSPEGARVHYRQHRLEDIHNFYFGR